MPSVACPMSLWAAGPVLQHQVLGGACGRLGPALSWEHLAVGVQGVTQGPVSRPAPQALPRRWLSSRWGCTPALSQLGNISVRGTGLVPCTTAGCGGHVQLQGGAGCRDRLAVPVRTRTVGLSRRQERVLSALMCCWKPPCRSRKSAVDTLSYVPETSGCGSLLQGAAIGHVRQHGVNVPVG